VKAIKKYLLIALGLLLLHIFSSMTQGKGKGHCCPFSIQPSNNSQNGATNE